jgi:hypothetical protein
VTDDRTFACATPALVDPGRAFCLISHHRIGDFAEKTTLSDDACRENVTSAAISRKVLPSAVDICKNAYIIVN